MNYLNEQGQFTNPATGGPITAPTVDSLGGTGATGKVLMKAADDVIARRALGMNRQTSPQPLASGATADEIATYVNTLCVTLKTAGILG